MENEPERPPPKHVYLDVEKFFVNGKGRFVVDPQDFRDERSLIDVHLVISPHEALRIEMMIAKAKAEAKAEAEAEAKAEQQHENHHQEQQEQEQQQQQEQQEQQQEEPLFEVDALTAAMIRFQDYYSNLCARICWFGLWASLALLGVCTIALLLLAAMQGIHDHYYTTPPQVVLAPHTPTPTNLFMLDAKLLAQSMTPARLNESQGMALFKLVSPPVVAPVASVAPTVEEEGCSTELCFLLVTAKSYLPAFLHTYIIGDPQEEDDDKNDAVLPPINYFDWVVDVDQAVFQGTTPAFLPSGRGPTTKESASAFYQMTLGHERKVKKYESVVESALNSLFVLDADLIKNAMTPARLSEVQAHALIDLFAEDKCCSVDDILCRLAALLGQVLGHDDDNSNDNFAWITTVWNSAIYRETTPAVLPSGSTDGDSGITYYQLTEGHSRNLDHPNSAHIMWQQHVEDFNTACPGTDSVFAIIEDVTTSFVQNTKDATKGWYIETPGSAPAFNLKELVKTVNARFREMRAIRWDYHMQGTVLYEKLKPHHNFRSTCDALWNAHPALRPTTLWEQFFRSLIFFGKPSVPPMPTIRRRSCTDLSPASGGVDPVEVAQCHAFARDPDRMDYDLYDGEYPPVWKRSHKDYPIIAWDVRNKRVAMPQLDEECHAREFLKYEFLQNVYDYSDICAALWAEHWHTKGVHYRADSSPFLSTDKSQKPFAQTALQSFCLSLDLDRTRDDFKTDPNRQHGKPVLVKPDIIRLIHTD